LNSFKNRLKTYLFHLAYSWFITRFVSNFYAYTCSFNIVNVLIL